MIIYYITDNTINYKKFKPNALAIQAVNKRFLAFCDVAWAGNSARLP